MKVSMRVLRSFGAAVVGADDEDGVVAGEGADDFGPLFVVERGGDGLGSADGGEDDEEVLGLADLEAEVLEDVADLGELFFLSGVGRGARSRRGL